MGDVKTRSMNRHIIESYRLQQDYGEAYGAEDPYDRLSDVSTYVLAACVELGEALNSLPWKPWRDYGGQAILRRMLKDNLDGFIEELVDVEHFIYNALYAMGVSLERYERVWSGKHERNRVRAHQEGGRLNPAASRRYGVRSCGVGNAEGGVGNGSGAQ